MLLKNVKKSRILRRRPKRSLASRVCRSFGSVDPPIYDTFRKESDDGNSSVTCSQYDDNEIIKRCLSWICEDACPRTLSVFAVRAIPASLDLF